MQSSLSALCFGVGLLGNSLIAAQQVATFDSATATSAIPSGAFPAADAVSTASGYWCSSGNHLPGERVTWTGLASVGQLATGVSINWAYGPGEYQILTSADGGNFESATEWRKVARNEKSYSETVLFDAPRGVKALAVVMRSPKAWGFFGINDISLLVQPGPAMLVAASTANAGEHCLVADVNDVRASDCLDAISSGTGSEIFDLSITSQLVSAATGKCISLVKRTVLLQDCEDAAEAGDGRSTFTLTPSSQLMANNGYCLSASAEGGASAVPCSSDLGGVVTLVNVPKLNLAPAARMRDAAALLRAAEVRQRSLLEQLKSGLEACRGLLVRNTSISEHIAFPALSQSEQTLTRNPALEASSKIDAAARIDLVAVKVLIAESNSALANVH